MLTNGACNNGHNCLYTHHIPEILIKDSKFVDSVTKNGVKNSLDENSISKSDPENINTQQSSFLLQVKTMYLEISKMFQQMQAMMFQANESQFVYPKMQYQFYPTTRMHQPQVPQRKVKPYKTKNSKRLDVEEKRKM